MSASSNCVTCGIITQLRARLAPEIFLIRDSGRVSNGPNLAKSTFGHGSRLSSPPPLTPPPAAPGAAPLIACLTKFCTSSCEDAAVRTAAGDAGEIDAEFARELAHRRRRVRRLEGFGVDWRRRCGGRQPELRGGGGAGRPAGAAVVAGAGFGAGALDAAARARQRLRPPRASPGHRPASSVRISVPSATLSPTLTFISFTVPAAGAGTSIVALSDSSVTSESSAATMSPGFTNTSMTGTSLKSPMSGTLTSIVLIDVASARIVGIERSRCRPPRSRADAPFGPPS